MSATTEADAIRRLEALRERARELWAYRDDAAALSELVAVLGTIRAISADQSGAEQ